MFVKNYSAYCILVLLSFYMSFNLVRGRKLAAEEPSNGLYCSFCGDKTPCSEKVDEVKCPSGTNACMLEGDYRVRNGKKLLSYRAQCAPTGYCPPGSDLMCLPVDNSNRKVCRKCCFKSGCNNVVAQEMFGTVMVIDYEKDTHGKPKTAEGSPNRQNRYENEQLDEPRTSRDSGLVRTTNSAYSHTQIERNIYFMVSLVVFLVLRISP